MPIYQILCSNCGNRFSGMVFAGTKEPELWVCSVCGSDKAKLCKEYAPVPHPLETAHGSGCPCCLSGETIK